MKLGQGNIFRSVCQEFCPQEGGCLGQGPGVRLRGLVGGCLGPDPGGGWGSGLGGVVSRPRPRGKVGGVLAGGVSRPTPGGCIPACPEADPPPSRWLLLRAVRILLEYILVFCVFNLGRLVCTIFFRNSP